MSKAPILWPGPAGTRIQAPARKNVPTSSTQPPATEPPPGTWDATTARCHSHLWIGAKKIANLSWERTDSPPSQPEAEPQRDTPLVQFQVPLAPAGGQRRHRPQALEVCCGHAGLTAALCDAGLDATGVDWKKNRHQPTIPILNVDLTTEQGQQFIMSLLQDETLLYVHMGPPCGTFTRARERPIPEWQRRWDAPCPGPLRSDDRPEGLSPRHLTPLDSLKVHKGNVIAEFCAKVASFCIEHNKFFSIENPTGSLLWKLPCYIELLSRPGVASVDFHACMWGSRRNKRTSFVTNMPQLEVLRKECPNDGSHEHAPWGLKWEGRWKFATQEECDYPVELCTGIASAAADATDAPPADTPPTRRKQKSKHGPAQAAERAAVGRQSRRHPRPDAVPERQPPTQFPVPTRELAENLRGRTGPVRETFAAGSVVIPAGARLLRVIEQRPVDVSGSDQTPQWICEIAMPWSPEDFFAQAVGTQHPMEQEPPLPDRTKTAIFEILTKGKKAWLEEKAKQMADLKNRMESLE